MPVQPFIGQLMPVAFNFAPVGWALCNGQLLSISQNTALFSLLGTFYGGDGKTTFGLPNLQGNVAIGIGQGQGLSPYGPGDTGGSASITLQLNQLAAHPHSAAAFGRTGNAASPSGADWAKTTSDTPYSTSGPNASMSPSSTGLTGSGQPHENRQPFLVLNYVIALTGIYPKGRSPIGREIPWAIRSRRLRRRDDPRRSAARSRRPSPTGCAAGGSIALTTYQAGKVGMIGWDGQQVTFLFRDFPKPMGLDVNGPRLLLATRHHLIELGNDPLLAHDFLEGQPGRYNALYLPRVTHATGDLNVRDVAYGADGPWMVNARFSCLAGTARDFSFVPRWRPPFVSEIVPEDRCHLNGLAMQGGVPRFVTALGDTDAAGGWRPGQGRRRRGDRRHDEPGRRARAEHAPFSPPPRRRPVRAQLGARGSCGGSIWIRFTTRSSAACRATPADSASPALTPWSA